MTFTGAAVLVAMLVAVPASAAGQTNLSQVQAIRENLAAFVEDLVSTSYLSQEAATASLGMVDPSLSWDERLAAHHFFVADLERHLAGRASFEDFPWDSLATLQNSMASLGGLQSEAEQSEANPCNECPLDQQRCHAQCAFNACNVAGDGFLLCYLNCNLGCGLLAIGCLVECDIICGITKTCEAAARPSSGVRLERLDILVAAASKPELAYGQSWSLEASSAGTTAFDCTVQYGLELREHTDPWVDPVVHLYPYRTILAMWLDASRNVDAEDLLGDTINYVNCMSPA